MMQTISTTGITNADGTLTLSLPVGLPNAIVDAVVVLQTRGQATPSPPSDSWQTINLFRNRLAESGQTFSDSAALIREDRDR
ncbi:MAG: hypothetical protein ACRCZF_04800 [Gemmataceae bacterium]